MTNVFVGFQDHQRNGSRILKPPGGGTSDFFNFGSTTNSQNKSKDDIKEVETESKNNNSEPQNKTIANGGEPSPNNAIVIQSVSESVESKKDLKSDDSPVIEAHQKTMVNNRVTINNIITQNEVVITEKKTSNRVPPGGFSKGLW